MAIQGMRRVFSRTLVSLRKKVPEREVEHVPLDNALERILGASKQFYPKSEKMREKIRQAYNVAKEAHAGQKRADGQEYIVHPASVALTVAMLGGSANLVCAALLHDVPEDCFEKNPPKYSFAGIREKFGQRVAALVAKQTKPHFQWTDKESGEGKWVYAHEKGFGNGDFFHERVERECEGKNGAERMEIERRLREERAKLLYDPLHNSADVEAIIGKLADNLHNIYTLGAFDPGKPEDFEKMERTISTSFRHNLPIARVLSKWFYDYYRQQLGGFERRRGWRRLRSNVYLYRLQRPRLIGVVTARFGTNEFWRQLNPAQEKGAFRVYKNKFEIPIKYRLSKTIELLKEKGIETGYLPGDSKLPKALQKTFLLTILGENKQGSGGVQKKLNELRKSHFEKTPEGCKQFLVKKGADAPLPLVYDPKVKNPAHL